MSARDHVRALLAGLEECDEWRPSSLGSALLEGHDPTTEALESWVERIDQVRVGNGAIELHRRHRADSPPPVVEGLEDHQALLLCVTSLAAGARLGPPASLPQGQVALDTLARHEPDFFDELLLGASVRFGNEAPFRQAVYAEADVLNGDRLALHTQASQIFEPATGLGPSIRRWVGMDPDLKGGEWARWAKAVVASALLSAKP